MAEMSFPDYTDHFNYPDPPDKNDIKIIISQINKVFDGLRPLWLTVTITYQPEKAELSLYVSDSGWPARFRSTGISLNRHSRGAGLAILRAKAAELISDIFDRQTANQFLAYYGQHFNDNRFDLCQGLSIHELHELFSLQTEVVVNPDFTVWADLWETETWRQGRHFFEQKSGDLLNVASSLATTAYQKPPLKHFKNQTNSKPDKTTEKCIFRKNTSWIIIINRQGRQIHRSLMDGNYGGKEEALQQAITYRDAVIEAFPDLPASYQKMSRRGRNNTSGQTGIYEVRRKGVTVGWRAQIITRKLGTRREYFSIADYGEEKARELAIEVRKQWLENYLAQYHSDAKDIPQPFSDEEFAAIIKKLDERYSIRTRKQDKF